MMVESAILRTETLMHRLTHILACVTVVLHMVVGCCWHHAHAARIGHCRESLQAVAYPSCDDHGHGDHHACPGEPPHDHDHGCDTAPCVFVVPETGGTVRIGTIQPLGFLPPDVDTARPTTHLAGHRADAPQFRLRADLRLHLVNQVFLL